MPSSSSARSTRSRLTKSSKLPFALHRAKQQLSTAPNSPTSAYDSTSRAAMVLDGTVNFTTSHDIARMQDPAILRERAKVKLVPDEELGKLMPHRQSRVEITLADGNTYSKLVDSKVARLRHRGKPHDDR